MRGADENSSSSAAAQRLRAGDVVRTVEQYERSAPHDLEPSGRPHLRERFDDSLGVERRVEKGFDRGQRGRGVVGLVCAVERDQYVGIRTVRRVQLAQPTTVCEHVLAHAEVGAALHDANRRAVGEDRDEVGIGLAEHEHRLRLHDAGFLRGDLLTRRPEVLDVIDGNVRDNRDARLETVRRVPRPAEPDLDDGDIDGEIREPTERSRRQHFEVRRVRADFALDERNRPQQIVEVGIGDRHALVRHALVHAFEVRARVRTDGQTEVGGELRDHPRRRRLPVGAGQVDRRIFELRRPEVLEQGRDPLPGRMGCTGTIRGETHPGL